MEPRILVVTGLSCSGKDTVCQYLKERAFYEGIVHLSEDIIKPVGMERGVLERADLLPLYFELGTEYFFEEIKKRIGSKNRFIISSVRELKLYDMIKKEYGELAILLYLYANSDARWKRNQSRRRPFDFSGLDEFLDLESQEAEAYKMYELFQKADITIDNSGDKDQLFKELDTCKHIL